MTNSNWGFDEFRKNFDNGNFGPVQVISDINQDQGIDAVDLTILSRLGMSDVNQRQSIDTVVLKKQPKDLIRIQGFDFSINVMRALLWRHNNAVNLQALLQYKQDALDDLNFDFWEAWFIDVFSLETANAFGLSLWAVILNIPLNIRENADGGKFGFGEFKKNFNNGNFAPGAFALSVEDARAVLKLRYYQLVTRSTITECNKILLDVFGNLDFTHVIDGLDMTMSYVFSDYPSYPLMLVIDELDLLPRPSAVKIRSLIYRPNTGFGFSRFRKNFTNGNFKS